MSVDPKPFWNWFRAEEARFRTMDPSDTKRSRELTTRLHRAAPGLTWEIGGNEKTDGPIDLVISADGNEDLINEVLTMAEAAPEIPGWRVVPFRQAREIGSIRLGKRELAAKDVPCRFYFARNSSGDEIVGLAVDVYLPDHKGQIEDAMHGLLFLFLDALVGEYFVMTRLLRIQPFPLSELDPDDPDVTDLTELPRVAAEAGLSDPLAADSEVRFL